MSNLIKLFHVIHVVDDLPTAEDWYDRVFAGKYLFRGNYSPVEQRDASLIAFSDFVIEPMTPSREAGAGEKPVGRFHARFGAHFHSIAFYVSSVTEVWERLRAIGVRIVGDGGRELDVPSGAIYTHPRDTGGLLEFMEPPEDGGYEEPGWSDAYWREAHPLGLEHTSHATVVVRNLDKARSIWVDALGATPFAERESRTLGTRSLFVAAAPEFVVELAQPIAKDSAAGQELERNGEIMHAVTFKVRSLEDAAKHAAELGLAAERSDEGLELAPGQSLGARYRFTDAPLEGDPRVTG